MPFDRIVRMAANDAVTFLADGGDEPLFEVGLRFLAGLVGGEAKIAIGDEINGFVGGHKIEL
jgi:hypothetical protein